MTNLDLPTLIRCLEVMADETAWDYQHLGNCLLDPIEAKPYEVCAKALELVRLQIATAEKNIRDNAFGADRLSNQELKP